MGLNRDFSEFIACFAAHEVRFLIVGGYAVAAHGHPRYTRDLDVWVRVDEENAHRIVEALDDFGSAAWGWPWMTFSMTRSSFNLAASRSGSTC